MTKIQLETILVNFLEENLNTATPSSLNNIASIQLNNNRMLYPSDTTRYLFDSTHELILEYEKRGNNNYLTTVYPYSLVVAITAVNVNHPRNNYRRGI
jgi:hypothetical protein